MAGIRKILSRPDGETALANALAYYKNPANSGKPLGTVSKNKEPRTLVYVKPFSLPTDVYYPFTIEAVAITTYGSALGAHTVQPTSGQTVNPPLTGRMPRVTGARSAKIIVVKRTGDTGTYVAAKATKTNYLKYNTESVGLPFGRATANEKETEAFDAIAPAVKTAAGGTDNVRIYLQSEKFARSII